MTLTNFISQNIVRTWTSGHFTFWISHSLRPKTDQMAQLWSQTDVEFNQSQPHVIADVIGDSSLISPYFFIFELVTK